MIQSYQEQIKEGRFPSTSKDRFAKRRHKRNIMGGEVRRKEYLRGTKTMSRKLSSTCAITLSSFYLPSRRSTISLPRKFLPLNRPPSFLDPPAHISFPMDHQFDPRCSSSSRGPENGTVVRDYWPETCWPRSKPRRRREEKSTRRGGN